MSSAAPGQRDDARSRPSHAKYFEVMADDLGFLVARVNAHSVRTVNRMIRPLGLSVRSYAVLRLAASQQPPLQSELAHLLELDPSQVVALVHDLEAKGLVARTRTATDRRRNHVVATAAGRELLVPAKITLDAALDRAFAGLDDDEVELTRRAMLKLLTAGSGREDAVLHSSKGGSVA